MEDLVIREARRADLAAIVALFAADEVSGGIDTTDPGALPDYEAQFDRIAASTNETLFVAELRGAVVGTFELMIARSLPYRASTSCILEAVQVRPDMRGKRIGEAMVRWAMGEARRRGAQKLKLTSNLKRADAHRFYERLGFTRSHAGFGIAL